MSVVKKVVSTAISTILLAMLFVQSTASDTGHTIENSPMDEPLALTLCGVALLVIGFAKSSKQ